MIFLAAIGLYLFAAILMAVWAYRRKYGCSGHKWKLVNKGKNYDYYECTRYFCNHSMSSSKRLHDNDTKNK